MAATAAVHEGRAVRSWILHVDLDQFIAAVEINRRPELRGRPVVVGGDGDPTRARQVVATASYEARASGVHSGMPLRTAARRCPDAVFLPADRDAYEAASERVMATLRSFPAVVQVYGWDEAFLEVETTDPEAFARDIKAAVQAETGLSCAVGIGDNKHRAKLAAGFAKPGGIYRLTEENWMVEMGERPTTALWGIGRKTAGKLAELGLETVAQLAAADPDELAGVFGPAAGPYLQRLGRGEGGTEVSSAPRVARSRSRERTFETDLTDRAEMMKEVVALAQRLGEEVADQERRMVRVAVKVRFAPFFTRIRSLTLPEPTRDPSAISAGAAEVLARFDEERPVRLLGVRVEFERTGSPT